MTSILTNNAAIVGVSILTSINKSLNTTQDRVSSGLRVQTASDNAAYWAISTTMRSDRRALSAVDDALGLGQSETDVAATALDKTISVLQTFKDRLIAAKEPSVDKSKVQDELNGLKSDLTSIASSASFNGVNWLQTNIPDLAYANSVDVNFPGAISRSGESFSVQPLTLDAVGLSLFNEDGGGALQVDQSNIGDINGLRSVTTPALGVLNQTTYGFTGAMTLSNTNSISFDVTLDAGSYSPGVTYGVSIDRSLVDSTLGTTDGVISNRTQWANVLLHAFTNAGMAGLASAWLGTNPTKFNLSSLENTGQAGSSLQISNVQSDLTGGLAGGLENAPIVAINNTYAFQGFVGSTPFRLKRDVSFSFDLSVEGGQLQTFTIDRNTVNAALGTDDGIVTPGANMATVLNYVLQSTGIIASAAGNTTELSIDPNVYNNAGTRSYFSLTNIRDNIGNPPNFNILDVDVTTPGVDVDNYLNGVEKMLQKVSDGATTLGAFQTRLESQRDFAQRLGDTMDTAVGRLVDADMETESSRLSALQIQQQLAANSLNIANQAPKAIMSLFSH